MHFDTHFESPLGVFCGISSYCLLIFSLASSCVLANAVYAPRAAGPISALRCSLHLLLLSVCLLKGIWITAKYILLWPRILYSLLSLNILHLRSPDLCSLTKIISPAWMLDIKLANSFKLITAILINNNLTLMLLHFEILLNYYWNIIKFLFLKHITPILWWDMFTFTFECHPLTGVNDLCHLFSNSSIKNYLCI